MRPLFFAGHRVLFRAAATSAGIVSFHVPSGGWGNNMRRTGAVRVRGQSCIADPIDPDSSSADQWRYVGTIDNGATVTEIRHLAKVQAAQVTDRDAIRRSIVLRGRRTLWGQQHDALTQSPTSARAYEMPALASTESAKIVDFLMTIPAPDARVRAAVHAAADFFAATRLGGKRYNRDRGALEDAVGSDAWSRFYDLGLYNPSASAVGQRARALFGDRPDTHASSSYGLIFGSLASVSLERRQGYAQYGNAAQATLTRYASWRAQNPR